MSVHLAFDSLCLRDSRLFGWGWLLDEQLVARRIELVLRAGDNQALVVRCHQAGSRDDLADAYPEIAHARGGGFLLHARLPFDLNECEAWVKVGFSDGSEQTLPLPDFPRRYLTRSVAVHLHNRWRLARHLCAAGRWNVLLRRVASALVRGCARLRSRFRSALAWRAAGKPVLIIDHDMGGGANHFRNELVASLRARGQRVLLLVPHLASLSYALVEPTDGGERRRRFGDLATCLKALPECAEIIVNSLVSFDAPGLVLDWLLSTPADTHLTYYLHDYHAACPVWTLVDERGYYCGIPARERCQQCLAANDAPFLALMPALDISDWRLCWGRFLARAERVIAFSRTSADVLRKAFPELPAAAIVVKPHDTSYIKPEPVAFDLGLPLVIGVVGHINNYKGAKIVAEMARIVERESLPARIVVIGSIDNTTASAALRVTGAYRSEQLATILRSEHVGICLLPSIWHETFSYVTAEIMAHGMPLAVFDLGAPAERVRAYARGCIIPEISARAALNCIFTFRDALLAELGDGVSPPPGSP